MLSGHCLTYLYALIRNSVLALTGALLLAPLTSSADSDVPGSADPEGLQRYPLSYIVEYQQHPAPEYWLALGPMKKINGVIAAEKSEAIAGHLSRITYRIPDGHHSRDGYDHFLVQLQSEGYQLLYQCEGRRCGSSNQWANSQFGIAQLYGVDREQFYAALRSPDQQQAVAIYGVKRGNKRIYLHLDVIRVAETKAIDGALSRQLRAGERVYVRLGDPLDSLAAGLTSLFDEEPSVKVRLVGHSDRGADGEARLRSSQVDAERVRDRLAVLGVPIEQLETHGVGDLAPAFDADIPLPRVELVLE